jgi:D-serine deaminase-like pyridoxal phosphate-dependent protein
VVENRGMSAAIELITGELDTPFLAVDLDVMERNLASMAGAARARGFALRPHAKTHKCLEIARRQVEHGAAGLTVATVGEAEIFASGGFTDLFIAYPIWAVGGRGNRLRALAERVSLRVGIDSGEGAQALAKAVAGAEVEALVEIDSGHHRSGVRPEQAAEVATAAARAGLRVSGIFTFPGHGYGPGQRGQAAGDEAGALTEARASMRKAGLEVEVSSGGSTPTAALADAEALTEIRPGVYVFNDTQQAELGSCDWPDIALTAISTVVSSSGRRVVLDAGSKVLGADQPAWVTGGGRLPDHPGARVVALSEHHATVVLPEDGVSLRPGDVVRVAPNHVCAAVNLADELIVLTNGVQRDRWQVAARGANA